MQALEQYPPFLSTLPGGWKQMNRKQKLRELLRLKLEDAGHYVQLRAQAIRCAPDQAAAKR